MSVWNRLFGRRGSARTPSPLAASTAATNLADGLSAPPGSTPFALFVFNIPETQEKMAPGKYSTYSWAHYARDVVATHIEHLAPQVVEPTTYVAVGELLAFPAVAQHVVMAVSASDWHPNLDLLDVSTRESFKSGTGLAETFYVIGIGGVDHAVTSEAHGAILASAPAGYRGVIRWVLPGVTLVAQIATNLSLEVETLRPQAPSRPTDKAPGEKGPIVTDDPDDDAIAPSIDQLLERYFEGGGTLDALSRHPERNAAIAPLLVRYRGGADGWKVCKALEAVGIASIDALLEVLRSSQRVLISPKGRVLENKERPPSGHAAEAAASLAAIPGAIDALRERCSETERLDIFLRAHNYGHDSEGVLRELGRIGGGQAVNPLLNTLFDAVRWSGREQRTEAAKQALIAIGGPALSSLADRLRMGIPDRDLQTAYRVSILEVLAVSGDESCVEIIRSVAESDLAIVDAASSALSLIAARTGLRTAMPDRSGVRRRREFPSTGSEYVDNCFALEFDELDEVRDWQQIEGLREVPDLVQSRGRASDATAILDVSKQQYSDFYFVYQWLARISLRDGNVSRAIEILNDGCRMSRRKYSLYNLRAEVEWDLGDIRQAVLWWVRSVISQRLVGGHLYTPYVYLGHLAGTVAGQQIAKRVFSVADSISRDPIRLNSAEQEKMIQLGRSGPTEEIRQVILALDEFVLGEVRT